MTEAAQPPKDLIGFLDFYLVQKAPFQLPDNAKEWIVKYGPWIAIVLLILALPPLLFALGLSTVLVGDVAYAAVLHMKRSAHQTVLGRLRIPLERSIYLSDYGHMGQVDPLLSLKLARDSGRIKDGDVCVLMAAGIGYVWNALCVRYRERE